MRRGGAGDALGHGQQHDAAVGLRQQAALGDRPAGAQGRGQVQPAEQAPVGDVQRHAPQGWSAASSSRSSSSQMSRTGPGSARTDAAAADRGRWRTAPRPGRRRPSARPAAGRRLRGPRFGACSLNWELGLEGGGLFRLGRRPSPRIMRRPIRTEQLFDRRARRGWWSRHRRARCGAADGAAPAGRRASGACRRRSSSPSSAAKARAARISVSSPRRPSVPSFMHSSVARWSVASGTSTSPASPWR
jgi:hypothetical protein